MKKSGWQFQSRSRRLGSDFGQLERTMKMMSDLEEKVDLLR